MRRFLATVLACVLAASAFAGSLSITGYPGIPNIRSTPDFSAIGEARLNFTRTTPTQDYTAGGVLTTFAAGKPSVGTFFGGGTINGGMGVYPLRANYLINSEAPATQTRSLVSGTYVASELPADTGSFTISGQTSGCTAAVTATAPCAFYLSATTSVTFTPTGTISHWQAVRTSASQVTAINVGPPIVTSATAPVTYNADVPYFNLAAVGDNGAEEVTFYVPNTPPATARALLEISDGTTNNAIRVSLQAGTNRPQILVLSGGTTVSSLVLTTAVAQGTAPHRLVLKRSATGYGISIDAAAVKNVAFAMPATVYTRAYLGVTTGGALGCECYISGTKFLDGSPADGLAQELGSAPVSFPSLMYVIEHYGQSNAPPAAHSTPALTTTPINSTHSLCPNDTWACKGAGPTTYTSYQTTGGYTGAQPSVEYNGTATFPASDYGETVVSAVAAQVLNAFPAAYLLSRGDGSPGQTISGLAPGGTMFTNRLGFLSRTKQLANIAGTSVVALASTWVHGGTDASNNISYADYYNGQDNIETTWNNFVKTTTPQTTNSPLVTLQVSNYSTPVDTSTVAQAQIDYAVAPPFADTTTLAAKPALAKLCGQTYQFPHNPLFGPHFTNLSQQRQGDLLGQCYADLYSSGLAAGPVGDTRAVYPTAIVFHPNGDGTTDRSKIDITWHDKTNLAIDETGIIQGKAPNDGFQFSDTCNDGITATGFSILTNGVNGTTQVQLSGAVGSGCKPRVSNAVKITTPGQPTIAIASLSWSGGVATATTTTPHGLVIGQQYPVTIQGNAPAGYNVTTLPSGATSFFITPTDASTFTYPLATNPGTATAFGTIITGKGAGAWSNLRDDCPTTGALTGLPVCNWSAIFNDLVQGG